MILLPVACKVMERVIIERIQNGLDHVLRKEQAGFRKNKSTVDQLFILRNITEQVKMSGRHYSMHTVDFEKAFDSVHREGLGRIMKAYIIPDKLIRMVKIMYGDFECSVPEEGEQTRWLKISSGVKQGWVMSCFLFLLILDWTMRRTTERHRNGIRWNFTSMLEDLDFSDGIVLVSSKYEHIQNKTNRLVHNAGRLGLKLNAKKCKIMSVNTVRKDKVMIGREEVEDVEEFIYLGTVTKEGGGTDDIKKRLRKARGAFFNLKKIWNIRSIGRNTKIKLFKTLARPVLLYGCEAWKLTVAKEKKLDRFQFTCLKRILRIWWPQRIRNDTISQVTGA